MALVSSAASEVRIGPVTIKGQQLQPPNCSTLLSEWCPGALLSVGCHSVVQAKSSSMPFRSRERKCHIWHKLLHV